MYMGEPRKYAAERPRCSSHKAVYIPNCLAYNVNISRKRYLLAERAVTENVRKEIKMEKRMKRILGVLMVLWMSCLWTLMSLAAEPDRKVVRVGYIDYEGFIEQQGNGNYTGYGVQYLNEIAKYTNWKYEYVYGSWAELMEQLKDGKIDLICQAQKN